MQIYITERTWRNKSTTMHQEQDDCKHHESEEVHNDVLLDTDEVLLRSVTKKDGKHTRYCFHKGCRYWFCRVRLDGGHKYLCAHMRGIPKAVCNAGIVVYFEEEEKKEDCKIVKRYTLLGEHRGTYEDGDHEMWDEGDIALLDFNEDYKHRIDRGLPVHEAYHEACLYNPAVAEELVRG